MIEVSIPQTSNYLTRHSAFQWTLTIMDNPLQRRRLQYASCNVYEEMCNMEINGYVYEKLIFDFENGRLIILIKNNDKMAVQNVLNALTIHTSPTSKMFHLKPGRKRQW